MSAREIHASWISWAAANPNYEAAADDVIEAARRISADGGEVAVALEDNLALAQGSYLIARAFAAVLWEVEPSAAAHRVADALETSSVNDGQRAYMLAKARERLVQRALQSPEPSRSAFPWSKAVSLLRVLPHLVWVAVAVWAILTGREVPPTPM